MSLTGFSRLKALSTAFNDQPHAASRWDQGGWTQCTIRTYHSDRTLRHILDELWSHPGHTWSP